MNRKPPATVTFQFFFEAIPDAAVAVDDKGYIVLANALAETMFGYPPKALLGKRLEILLPERIRKLRARQRRDYFTNPRTRPMVAGLDLVGRRKDGTEFPVEINLAPLRTEEGIWSVAVIRDLTESRTLRHELAHGHLKSFFASAPAGLAILDSDLRYLQLNETLARTHGRPVEENLGKSIREVLPKLAPVIEPIALRVLATGEPALNFEASGETPARPGVLRHWRASYFPILGLDGRPAAIGVIVVEVTEQKRAEEEIRRLNIHLEGKVEERTRELQAAVGELEAFSYSVSHDLRVPLRAIKAFSSMLLEDSGHRLDSDGRHYLQVIQENTQKMGHMIDDLLEFSRLGRQEMKLSSFDLGALAAEVFEELRRAEDTRAVQFKLEPLPPARGDRVMLRQVLVNLLSNAMKFTRTKDTAVVQMGGSEQEGENVYYVKDNGVGFDPQYAHKLFGVFQRLHSQEEFEGTGVGLAIVRQIVQRHGGRIWAEAKLGQEAIFFFTLPKGLTS